MVCNKGEMKDMLVLPSHVRERLKSPLGKLYRGNGAGIFEDMEELDNASFVAVVGDVVFYNMMRAGKMPDIAVIDGKTMRREVDENIKELIECCDFSELRARNPAGTITSDLVLSLEKAVKETRVKVVVDGEEDLSVLPLAMLLPEGSIVLYGQPSEGIVAVRIDEEKRMEICQIIGEMEGKDKDWFMKKLCRRDVHGN